MQERKDQEKEEEERWREVERVVDGGGGRKGETKRGEKGILQRKATKCRADVFSWTVTATAGLEPECPRD